MSGEVGDRWQGGNGAEMRGSYDAGRDMKLRTIDLVWGAWTPENDPQLHSRTAHWETAGTTSLRQGWWG